MKKTNKNTLKKIGFGFISGALSATAGAGGGMIIVPFLKRNGFTQKSAQQTAVACILPISAISAAAYIFKGYVSIKDSLPFIPAGLLGAAVGSVAINKISSVWLKIIFGAFMVYAGWRLMFR